ncbi:MAG TPA: thiamine phosphate synthase [Pirellulales bacterium]|jgi:thiamine-phosphate pyrophosphorylase
MGYDFTPAAERALEAAAAWTACSDDAELHLPEVLLGLLAEPECRSALLLAQCDVDPQAVHRKFPQLAPAARSPSERLKRFSPELTASLETAEHLLSEYPRPLTLATEHILLGVVALPGEVADWLAACGLTADALEQEVHRIAGHRPGPLPIDDDDAPAERPLEFESASAPPGDELATLRILDAAANRASEGLRVVEDFVRLGLDDRHLTGLAKQIRHDLAEAMSAVTTQERLAARDTIEDVGTELTTAAELARESPAAVARASFKRAQQALRTLEEYGKLVPELPRGAFEQLRYRLYTLERAVGITDDSVRRLSLARLCVLIDAGASQPALEDLVDSLVACGVPMLQLREKNLPDLVLLERARLIRQLTLDTETLFIVNDRADLAYLAQADGVHLGQDDISVKEARCIVGPRALVGVSTHSIEQARAAVLSGANYIGVGPTFPSTTKLFEAFPGVELLRAVAAEIRLPAFAIGGIAAANLPQVLEAGFKRVAVSGAVIGAAEPAAAAARLLSALSAAG